MRKIYGIYISKFGPIFSKSIEIVPTKSKILLRNFMKIELIMITNIVNRQTRSSERYTEIDSESNSKMID